MRLMRSIVECLVVLLGLWSYTAGQMMTRSNVTLERNQYKNIVIAIGNDVPEDIGLIDRIKAIFTETSKDLFQATLARAFFKDITIVVPHSWSNRPEYGRATTQSFDKANIVVDKPNTQYGDNPYVLQLAGCGQQGEYMHLTPNYVTNEVNSIRTWGPYGKTLTHEWAHLRWGLFDEYATDDGDKHFYHSSSGNVEAVRCTLDVAGDHLHRLTGRACNMNATTSLPEDDCRLFPNYAATEASASYMFFHFMPTITTFCDNDTSNGLTLHNIESPSKHNRLCEGKSSWEIMREHRDFNNGANPSATGEVDTRPSFTVVKRQDTMRVVVVMDTSGSMNTNNNIMKLNRAVRRYILTTLPTGAEVGLVKFSSTARRLASLTQLNGDSDRNALANKVPSTATGGTAMGKGMQEGIRVLEQGGVDPAGSIMILVGDGKENLDPRIRDVLPTVLRKNIIVDTILYTAAADNQLISLAAKTGGMSFFYSGESDSSALRDALTTTSNQRQSNKTKLPVQVASDSISVSGKGKTPGKVYIDSVLGTDTRFLFSWNVFSDSNSANIIDVTLTAPNGDVFDKNHRLYQKDRGEIVVSIPNDVIQAGQWSYEVDNSASDSRTILMSIESKVKAGATDTTPITVVATVSAVELNFTKDISSTVVIYATVSKGYSPLVSANVFARIEKPSTNDDMDVYELSLLDNGAGADNTKDDGIYSGYFTKFVDKDGDYSVSVKVKNENGQAKIKTVTGQRALTVQFNNSELEKQDTSAKVSYDAAERFERATPGGYFKTDGIANRVNSGVSDFFAPSRISDLRVVEASYDKRTITLEFTAVGDDFVDGRASFYDIRVARNFTDLYANFENATVLSQTQLIKGNLTSPTEPLTSEVFVLRVSEVEFTSTFVYAIRAVDEENNKGKVSNIVSATLIKVDPEVNVLAIVLGVLAALLVIAIIVVAVVIYKKGTFKRKNAYVDKNKKKDVEMGSENKAYANNTYATAH